VRWWIKVYRVPWVIAAALAAVILASVFPAVALPVPSLSGGNPFAGVRSFALISVLITILTWSLVGLAAGPASLVASRFSATAAVTVPAIVVATVGVGAVSVHALSQGAATAEWLLLRDVIGLLALSVLLLRWTGYRYAGIVPTVYLFISAVFGRDLNSATERAVWWAWPVADSLSLEYWLVALLLGAAAAVTSVRAHTAALPILVAQSTRPTKE
jgi:hypothetical protein